MAVPPPTPAKVKGKARRRKHRRRKSTALDKGGRPTVLTEAITAAVERTIAEDAVTFRAACRLNGVGKSTAYRWLAAAEALAEGKPLPEEVPQHVSPALLLRFRDAVEKGQAVDEQVQVARIVTAAKGGHLMSELITEHTLKDGTVARKIERKFQLAEWTAAAWLLERRDPDRWGRKFRYEQPGQPGTPGGKLPTLAELLTEVWAQRPVDPRALPPGVIDGGQAVKVS
jgi:hypothetical protein